MSVMDRFYNWNIALQTKQVMLAYLQSLFRTTMARDLGYGWDPDPRAVSLSRSEGNKDGITYVQIQEMNGMDEEDSFKDDIIRIIVSRSPVSIVPFTLDHDNTPNQMQLTPVRGIASNKGQGKTNLANFSLSIAVICRNGLVSEMLASFIAVMIWATQDRILNRMGLHKISSISIGPEYTVYPEENATKTRQAVQVDLGCSMQIRVQVDTLGFICEQIRTGIGVKNTADNTVFTQSVTSEPQNP